MKVLVYGSGQLAQMMYLSSTQLGVEVLAVDVSNETVVHPVSKQVVDDFDIATALNWADAITVEFEHVPEHLLVQADKTDKLYPNIASILAGADRVREKLLLQTNGIANCQHEVIDDVAQLSGITDRLGERIIFKASRDGYDGYGQWRLTDATQLPALIKEFEHLDLSKVPLIAEKMLNFDREISIVGARDKAGNVKCFVAAENLHYQGQLHVSIAPATHLSPMLESKAVDIFKKLAEAMDYVGVLAVELFQCGDELLVNEIAPRVHNSGHWTQQGCQTDQFQQHIRAILGLPLGSTDVHGCSAMVNIIGYDSVDLSVLNIAGCNLHWYGKSIRAKRKMGHINLVAKDHHSLGLKISALAKVLPNEFFPHLLSEATRLAGE